MATFTLDKKLVQEELRLLRDPIYEEERPYILDFVRRLHRALSPQDYFQLHVKLLGRLRARQLVLGEIKETVSDGRARIAELAKDRERNREALEREQNALALALHQQAVQRALRFALLNIGDGLAWRALTYDRAGITVLGEGKRVAWLADKDGFDAEVQAIDGYWQKGIFAFHNDITTCIRHGDITAMGPDGREVVEVKRGKKTGDSPQMRRLEAATTLLNTGRHVGEDGRVRAVVSVPVPYRTFLANLRDLIARARCTGYAAARVGQMQFVAAVDHRVPGDPAADQHAKALRKLGWFEGSPRLFTFTSAHRRMRERRESFPGIAPFSIFPFPAEDVADLVHGYLDFYSLLNIDMFERYLTQQGLTVDIAAPGDADAGDRFMLASRVVGSRQLMVRVAPQLREQMLMELLTPSNVAASVSAVLDAVEGEPKPAEVERVPRMDESRVWP